MQLAAYGEMRNCATKTTRRIAGASYCWCTRWCTGCDDINIAVARASAHGTNCWHHGDEPERCHLSGAALSHIDVDGIFNIEKRDRSYVPRDRAWFQGREWSKM